MAEVATWILVIFVHAGILSKGDSMAITSVPGFPTETACKSAGEASKALTGGTVKETRFVCLRHR